MRTLEISTQARATGVKIEAGYICVVLSDEREIRFPISKNRRLSKASSDALKKVDIICNGTGLHWSDLDEDLSVQGIVEGRFGT